MVPFEVRRVKRSERAPRMRLLLVKEVRRPEKEELRG
jgi:hypothetical protein